MPAVQRVTDKNDAGGIIMRGDNTVMVNGLAIAIPDAPVSNHPNGKPPHSNAKTKASQSTVKVNGKAVVTTNSSDTCGHKRVGGSTDVKIGD